MIVLSEVASRALSPAVNDPGTAIDVLRAGTRVLEAFHRARADAQPAGCRHVTAPDIDLEQAYEEFFAPIARDGAALVEVQEIPQSSVAHLGRKGDPAVAGSQADAARAVAAAGLSHTRDLARLRVAHQGQHPQR